MEPVMEPVAILTQNSQALTNPHLENCKMGSTKIFFSPSLAATQISLKFELSLIIIRASKLNIAKRHIAKTGAEYIHTGIAKNAATTQTNLPQVEPSACEIAFHTSEIYEG
jgi:hypothetical protein